MVGGSHMGLINSIPNCFPLYILFNVSTFLGHLKICWERWPFPLYSHLFPQRFVIYFHNRNCNVPTTTADLDLNRTNRTSRCWVLFISRENDSQAWGWHTVLLTQPWERGEQRHSYSIIQSGARTGPCFGPPGLWKLSVCGCVEGKKEQWLCQSPNALPFSLSDTGTSNEGGTTGSHVFMLRGLLGARPTGQFPLQKILCETAAGPGLEEGGAFFSTRLSAPFLGEKSLPCWHLCPQNPAQYLTFKKGSGHPSSKDLRNDVLLVIVITNI